MAPADPHSHLMIQTQVLPRAIVAMTSVRSWVGRKPTSRAALRSMATIARASTAQARSKGCFWAKSRNAVKEASQAFSSLVVQGAATVNAYGSPFPCQEEGTEDAVDGGCAGFPLPAPGRGLGG